MAKRSRLKMKLTNMAQSIESAIRHGDDLHESQVSYVREYIEPKYENDCNTCRLNVLLALGVSLEEAFEKAARP